MVFVVNPFSKIDEIRYCSWLLFNRGFFIMIVDKVDIVSKSQSGSPEKESINPPSKSVSVLF